VKKYPVKKTLIYRERDEASRVKFVRRIQRISPRNLIYVDEAGINEYLYWEYARAPRGQKVIGEISGKKYKRTNIVSGYCCGKWVAPLQYNGSTDSILFEYWFEECLLKEVRGKFIVLDNATFHRKKRLIELAETKKCKVIFLPAYSPDLNPIEKKWAWLKKKIRDSIQLSNSLDISLWNAFQLE
jgi:transposase